MDQGLRRSHLKTRFWCVGEAGRRRRGLWIAAPRRLGGILVDLC
uniref:Uncharacterized protein n=1 Tax=Arundo donax TaxID=35708 RepID=A0A0A9AP32_ARUDO